MLQFPIDYTPGAMLSCLSRWEEGATASQQSETCFPQPHMPQLDFDRLCLENFLDFKPHLSVSSL